MPIEDSLSINPNKPIQVGTNVAQIEDPVKLTAAFIQKESTAKPEELIELVGKVFKPLKDYNAFIQYRNEVVKTFGNKEVISRMLNLAEKQIRPFCWQIIEDIHESFYKAVTGQITTLPILAQKEFSFLSSYSFSPDRTLPVLFVSFRRGLELKFDFIDPHKLFCTFIKECEDYDLEKMSFSLGVAKNNHLFYGKEISYSGLLLDRGNKRKEYARKEEDGYGIFMLPIVIENAEKKPFIAGVADNVMRIPRRESGTQDFRTEQKGMAGKIYYLLPPFVQSYYKTLYSIEMNEIEPLSNLPKEIPPYEYVSSQFERALRKNQEILKKPVLPEYPVQRVYGPFGWVGKFAIGEDGFAKEIKEDLRRLPDNSADFEAVFDIALKRCQGDILTALDALRGIIRRSNRNFAETTIRRIGGEGATNLSSELRKRGIQIKFLEETLVEEKLKDIPGLPSRVKRSTYDHTLAFVLSGYYFQSIIEGGDEAKVKEEFTKYENDTLEYTCNNPASTKSISECVGDYRKDKAWLEQEGLFVFNAQKNKYDFNSEFSFLKLGVSGLFGQIGKFKQNLMGAEGFFIYRLFKKSAPGLFSMAISMQKASGKWFFPEYEIVTWTKGLEEDLGHGYDMHIEQMVLETYACRLGPQMYFMVDSMIENK